MGGWQAAGGGAVDVAVTAPGGEQLAAAGGKGDVASVLALYERCLVPCARYAGGGWFWSRVDAGGWACRNVIVVCAFVPATPHTLIKFTAEVYAHL
jgi:hypothetical protein